MSGRKRDETVTIPYWLLDEMLSLLSEVSAICKGLDIGDKVWNFYEALLDETADQIYIIVTK